MKMYISGFSECDKHKDAIEALKAKLCDLGFEAVIETGNHLVDVLALIQADVAYFIDGWFNVARYRSDFDICIIEDKPIIFQKPLPIYDDYKKTINLQNTLHEVTGVSFNKIRSPSRKQELFYARTLFAWYCHNVIGMALSSIGQLINRDHSTICCCLKKYDELMEAKNEPDFRINQQRLMEMMNRPMLRCENK